MRTLAISAALLLAACSTPHLMSGNEVGGVIGSYGLQPRGAFAEAEGHCAKFNKVARVTGQNDLQDQMTFECVSG